MKFVLTCGGTAGHVNPALAVAGRLKELLPDSRFLFLGAEGKMEMDLVPRAGYEIKPLKITNIARGRSLAALAHNVDTVKNVISSEREARRILKDFGPDAVIGTGGYVCYPVLMAAARLHIPTLVHESNALPGLTTRMLADRVDAILVGFERAARIIPIPGRSPSPARRCGASLPATPGRRPRRSWGSTPTRRWWFPFGAPWARDT